MREQPTSQLRLKKKRRKKRRKRQKKRRRRKRRKNKCFLTDLLRPSDNSPSHVLHLKTSITSTSPQLPTHPKQQKTISFHESFVKISDLVSNRLETSGLASKQNIDSLTSEMLLNVCSHIKPSPNSFLFRLFFTHTLLSFYNCDFGTIHTKISEGESSSAQSEQKSRFPVELLSENRVTNFDKKKQN